jgi:CelD/BcsL family acetyltransferase involved in cellulose biosynthesis
MTRAALIVLGLMFAATVGALVATQSVKDEPAYIHRVKATRLMTPNADGYHDTAVIRFVLGRPDTVSVAVADAHGRIVRHLRTRRDVPADRRVRFHWGGRTDSGARAPDGTYTVRVTLARLGRTIELHKRIRLRNVPPHYRRRSGP